MTFKLLVAESVLPIHLFLPETNFATGLTFTENQEWQKVDNGQDQDILSQKTFKKRERTNCMHRNRGNLTVGLKTETVEMVGIIFPRPPAPKPTFWE